MKRKDNEYYKKRVRRIVRDRKQILEDAFAYVDAQAKIEYEQIKNRAALKRYATIGLLIFLFCSLIISLTISLLSDPVRSSDLPQKDESLGGKPSTLPEKLDQLKNPPSHPLKW